MHSTKSKVKKEKMREPSLPSQLSIELGRLILGDLKTRGLGCRFPGVRHSLCKFHKIGLKVDGNEKLGGSG
jgi:hypothetical protein